MKRDVSILSIRNLCAGYGRVRVVEGVDLDFYPGEFVSLLGPNGAGKTTLLRTLSRLQPSLAGRIRLKGIPLDKISSPRLARTLSLVLGNRRVPPLFQVYEFVAMGRYPYTVWTGRLSRADDRAVSGALEMVGARDLAFRDLETLNNGEKQKIFIARALAREPEIILLDEPTVHLPPGQGMEIMSLLRLLCREKGLMVLASLNDLEVAAGVSDRVALIRYGQVSEPGPPEDVLNRLNLDFLDHVSDRGGPRPLFDLPPAMAGATGRLADMTDNALGRPREKSA